MRTLLLTVGTLALLWGRAGSSAGEGGESGPKEATAPKKAKGTDVVEFILADGSRVSGKVSLKSMTVETVYGQLTVPISEVVRLRVAQGGDAKTRAKVAALIKKLGSSAFQERQRASDQILKLGALSLEQLKAATRNSDAEVRSRAQKLLEEVEEEVADSEEECEEEAPLIAREDELVTRRFTARGRVKVEKFALVTKYGALEVPRDQVICAHFGAPEEVTRRYDLTGFNTTEKILTTNLRVRRGNVLRFRCSGSIYFDDEEATCTPEGNAEVWDQDVQGFAGNAVIGRIGTGGPCFFIGKGATVRARNSGNLQLLLAYENSVGGAKGTYTVRVTLQRR